MRFERLSTSLLGNRSRHRVQIRVVERLHIQQHVARRLVVHRSRPGQRLVEREDRLGIAEVEVDRIRAVLGVVGRLGHDQGHRFACVPHAVAGEQGHLRPDELRPVQQGTQPSGPEVTVGEDCNDPRDLKGC